MSKWHLIQDQPLLREIYNEPPIISYKRAKPLGDILVRANYKVTYHTITSLCRVVFGLSTPSTGCYISFIVTGPVLESRENQKAGTARIATQVTRKERCINFFKM